MSNVNGRVNIEIEVDRDFELAFDNMKHKYGEGFEYLNGFHKTQLNFSDFINGFIDKNVADVTIDSNANASHKDVRSLIAEKGKSEDKLFAFNKIFFDMKKIYGVKTAKEWLETEWNGGFYLHDASSTSYLPYCFSGETEIMTERGLFELQNLVDDNILVLNRNHGWEPATVKCFGVQPLKKLTLTRYSVKKEIFVTGNHKWFKRGGEKDPNGKMKIVSTDELKSGDKIPFNTSITWSTISPSPFGVAHGFFTGDGDKGIHLRANFCGDKTALIPYFTPAKITGNEKEYTIHGIPEYFRYLPSLTNGLNYLYGWLSGYFAADGCVDTRGRCTLSSTVKENLQFARNVLCMLGMPVNEIRYQDRTSNLTGEMGRVYILTLSEEYLSDNFFIRPQHKERIADWRQTNEVRRDRNWIVESVENTDRVEPVYCAVVKGTESFTLAGNVLTHNCYAYDLTRLATEGLFFLPNYNHVPPKHLTTFVDDFIEYVSYMCNRTSGEHIVAPLCYFSNSSLGSQVYCG